MVQRTAVALVALLLLAGCGVSPVTHARPSLMEGDRFETLKSKQNIDPILRKAVMDRAKKALDTVERMASHKLDTDQLNDQAKKLLKDGVLTERALRDILAAQIAQPALEDLAELVDGHGDDYSKGVAKKLDAAEAQLKKLQAAKPKDDAAYLAGIAKQLALLVDTLKAIANNS